MWFQYLTVAYLMIRAKPIRSALSWLGIYIGVLSLVVILAIHAGARQEVEDLYRTTGGRVVLVYPGYDPVRKGIGRLSLAEVALLSSAPGVESVLPRLKQEKRLRSPQASMRARVAGMDEKFLTLYRVPIIQGRAFLHREIITKQPVCLLTEEAVKKLFSGALPKDPAIDMEGHAFQVIGTVSWNNHVAQRAFWMDEPDVLLPVGWLMEGETTTLFTVLEVRFGPNMPTDQSVELVNQALTHGDPRREKLYSIVPMVKFLERNREMSEHALFSLLAIAAVSLLVGTIGVANVMLTSVTERTREVGIRKALGATRKDILAQFLVESIVLCASGGILAVLTGWLVIDITSGTIVNTLPLAFPKMAMAACLALTLTIGLIAGLYPASRAAALSPAEALRYE